MNTTMEDPNYIRKEHMKRIIIRREIHGGGNIMNQQTKMKSSS